MVAKLHTVKDVAGILGCGQMTVRRRIAAGQISVTDIGVPGHPKIRISDEALQAYLKANTEASTAHAQ